MEVGEHRDWLLDREPVLPSKGESRVTGHRPRGLSGRRDREGRGQVRWVTPGWDPLYAAAALWTESGRGLVVSSARGSSN